LLPGVVITKRLRMQGFIVLDYAAGQTHAETRLAGWIESGALRSVLDIVDGLEKAPDGLIQLLAGGNVGKMAVRL
jgi:NADPH-dependent curcumin reductase CurA